MERTLKIYIEQHPNTDMRTAHVSLPLVGVVWSKYSEKGSPKKIKRLARSIERRQELNLGVGGGILDNKQISFERNKVFSWAEANSALVECLERHFRLPATVEVQEREAWMDRNHSTGNDY